MEVTTSRLLEALLLPPGGLLLLGLLGLLLVRTRFGRGLIALSLLPLLLLSLPVTSDLLYLTLESEPVLTTQRLTDEQPQAIVVLGGGRDLDAPEYAGDTVTPRALARLRYAAKLSRETGLPVIPSGGNPGAIGEAEAVIARHLLQDEFGVPVLEIERRSDTTWENARYTAQLMKQRSIERIILVTDAGHMKRSLYAFQRNGIDPIPAPMNFLSVSSPQISPILRYLPSATAFKESCEAVHELIGWLWYQTK
jgi:uncharacterized SAM-binding protein YcdF (DUF218 family)